MSESLAQLQYLKHYFMHTYYVVLAWKVLRKVLWEQSMITEKEFEIINNRIAHHDESKIEKEEFFPYAERFYGERKEDETVKRAFKTAVTRHKANNLHHYESLRFYFGKDWKCYIIELVCDYIAMGWESNNYILEYYEKAKNKIDLPEEYKENLEIILDIIRSTPELQIFERPLTTRDITLIDFVEPDFTLHLN